MSFKILHTYRSWITRGVICVHTWDIKVSSTYENDSYANIMYATFIYEKYIAMFVQITIFFLGKWVHPTILNVFTLFLIYLSKSMKF